MIPLILFLAKHGTVFPPDWRVTAYADALIFACLLIPVGTRGAHRARLHRACSAVLMLRATKRRVLYLMLLGAAGLAAVPFLPSSFGKRMETIQGYQARQLGLHPARGVEVDLGLCEGPSVRRRLRRLYAEPADDRPEIDRGRRQQPDDDQRQGLRRRPRLS